MNACPAPCAVVLLPTTLPWLLMAFARLTAPPKVPSGTTVYVCANALGAMQIAAAANSRRKMDDLSMDYS
jgi:hypothetical protein